MTGVFVRFCICSLGLSSIFLFSSTVVGQKPKSEKNQELFLWQQRVDNLTADVLNDTKMADDGERGIYLALLAKLLWVTDRTEALTHVNKAVDYTIRSLASDDEIRLESNLKNFQKVAQIITPLDQQLSRTLAERVATILEAKGKSGKSNADSFVIIALQLVETNPNLAFTLGVKSLSYGNARDLYLLIRNLNLKDYRLGEDLYRVSLAAAKRNYSYEFTSKLGVIVFSVSKGKTFSDGLRRSYLEMLAEMLAGAALIESERATGCEIVVLVTPILNRFDEYLPNQTTTVRQQIQMCLAFVPNARSELTKSEAIGDEPQTVEDLVRAARDSNDPFLKSRYFYKAITKLEQIEKYDQIISLLDGMTETEVKVFGDGAWDGWRSEYALQSSLVSIKTGDLPAVYSTINRTPKKLRPAVRLGLAFKLSPTENKDFILENLEETRKELDALDIQARAAAGSYLAMIPLYIKIQPLESENVFRQAVKAINKTDSSNPDNLPEKDYAPLRDYVRLPFEILEIDEPSIQSSLANISSYRSRIRLRLGLLESSLLKRAEIKKKTKLEKSNPEVSVYL